MHMQKGMPTLEEARRGRKEGWREGAWLGLPSELVGVCEVIMDGPTLFVANKISIPFVLIKLDFTHMLYLDVPHLSTTMHGIGIPLPHLETDASFCNDLHIAWDRPSFWWMQGCQDKAIKCYLYPDWPRDNDKYYVGTVTTRTCPYGTPGNPHYECGIEYCGRDGNAVCNDTFGLCISSCQYKDQPRSASAITQASLE